jgi:RHS repeat-associated protein
VTFDALGNRATQRNRTDDGPAVSVTWTHDPYGRILTRTADGTTTYTYDANGNRLTATAGTMTITATYDRLGRVLTVDDEDAGSTPDTTYTYSLTSPAWTDPTGSYTATLDKFDRPTAMTDPVSASGWTFSYGTAGQVTAITQGNGNTVASTYDTAGRELTRTTKTGSTTRAAYTWTHNRAGLVLSEASTITGDPANGTLGYGYDPLGRLITSGATGYAWDAATNRTGSGSSTTAFDAANRPTSGTSPTAAYDTDEDGQLTARPGQSMTWDHLGRLVSVTTAAGLTTYAYDPLDRLRTVTDPAGAVTRFRYTGLSTSAAQLLDGAGTVTRSIGNGWTGERLLDWVPGSPATALRYHGTNAHHDTTWLADSTGAVISSLRYDPWGVPRSAVPAGYTPFRFQGSWHDTSTDLAWVVTRWYAPGLGTFLSEDSLLGEPRDPDSRHLYAYAQGDPIGGWDPDGRLSSRFRADVPIGGPEVLIWGGHTFGGFIKIADKVWAQSMTFAWNNRWMMNVDQIKWVTTIEECGFEIAGIICIDWGRTLKRTEDKDDPVGPFWIRWSRRIEAAVEPGGIYRVRTVHVAILNNPREHLREVSGREFGT